VEERGYRPGRAEHESDPPDCLRARSTRHSAEREDGECRVGEPVDETASRSVAAARERDGDEGSPKRFCESVKVMPVPSRQPRLATPGQTAVPISGSDSHKVNIQGASPPQGPSSGPPHEDGDGSAYAVRRPFGRRGSGWRSREQSDAETTQALRRRAPSSTRSHESRQTFGVGHSGALRTRPAGCERREPQVAVISGRDRGVGRLRVPGRR